MERKGKMVKYLNAFVFLLIVKASFSQRTQEGLNQLVDSIEAEYFLDTQKHGLAIGVIDHGHAHQYYFGGKYYPGIDDVDSSTLFEIGSISKLFTTHILAELEKSNLLSRDDLLSEVIGDSLFVGSSEITLKNLATHTAGLPTFDNTASLQALPGFNEDDPYALFNYDFMLDLLAGLDSLSNYGRIQYSNFGMGILSYAMAVAADNSFDRLFEKYITGSLDLKQTYLSLPEKHAIDLAIPHRGGEVMPLINLGDMRGAGGIKTSLSDMLSFMGVYLNPEGDDKALVSSILSNQLSTDEGVGLGWGIYERNNLTLNFHTGGTYGSSSIVLIAPEIESGVVLLSNDQDDGKLLQYALSLIDFLHEK